MCDFRSLLSDVWYQKSAVRRLNSGVWYHMSDVRCLILDVLFQMSDFRCLISDVWCKVSDFRRLLSDVWFQVFDIRHPISGVWYLTADVRCLMSDIWCQVLLSDIWSQVSVVKRLILDVWLSKVCQKNDDYSKLETKKGERLSFVRHDQWNGKNKISSVSWEESRPDSLTISISSGFSQFCLKIPNPNQHAIGIGKIAILTSVLIFWMNSFYTYTRTTTRIYLIETDI